MQGSFLFSLVGGPLVGRNQNFCASDGQPSPASSVPLILQRDNLAAMRSGSSR